jgi:hypothetical protein
MSDCGCGRNFCSNGNELIHRDDRQHFEAASTLLAILRRCGPSEFTCGDIDAYAMKKFGKRVLLRLVEHKQPSQARKREQSFVLSLLNDCIQHYIENPPADANWRLDSRSGVFIMQGRVEGTVNGHRETRFHGPQTVMRIDGGSVRRVLNTDEDVFVWFEGQSGGRRRQNARRPE